MIVSIRMTKEQFDKYVREQAAPGIHESELELIIIKPDDNKDVEAIPVLSVKADNIYQE